MTHPQAVFLAHWIGLSAAFWLWCQYQSEKKKKSAQRGNAMQTKGNIDKQLYHRI